MTPKQKDRSCKAVDGIKRKYQKIMDLYELDPKRCLLCDVAITYAKRHNKFCNRSCAASYNNAGSVKNFHDGKYSKKLCAHCGKETCNLKFCCVKCFHDFNVIMRLKAIEETGLVVGMPKTVKDYLLQTKGRKCELCGITEWQGQDVPLVLDHINGKPSDSKLENLRLVCGNCNMQLSTFAGRNVGKGGGRPYRMERYRKGLSY